MQVTSSRINNYKSQAKKQALPEYISLISHELRVPLAIINEASSLLLDETAGSISDKQKRLLSKIIDNAERLRLMIEELLDVSRLDKGTIKLHYSLVNLNALINDSSQFFKKWAKEKNIELCYCLPKEEIDIFVDPQRIMQIISNLITNAIKFTKENGRVNVELKVIENNKVMIMVEDNGIGIAKDDLGKLFNRFVQVSRERSAERKGLGLGLSIARELVEKHGGEIWCDSIKGEGSKFCFTLPGSYATNVLKGSIREKINSVLAKNLSVYLINVSIINFQEVQKKANTKPEKLFEDLGDIIKSSFKNTPSPEVNKPQLALADYKNGVFNIAYPQASEKETDMLCMLIKHAIEGYFRKNKIKGIFINVGVLTYPMENQISDIYVKKIYIGPELRLLKRINYKSIIEIITAANKSTIVKTIDISKGGICFVSDTPFEKNTKIKIALELDPKKEKRSYIASRVAWVKDLDEINREDIKRYKVGVEFIKLSKENKNKLNNLIKRISS